MSAAENDTAEPASLCPCASKGCAARLCLLHAIAPAHPNRAMPQVFDPDPASSRSWSCRRPWPRAATTNHEQEQDKGLTLRSLSSSSKRRRGPQLASRLDDDESKVILISSDPPLVLAYDLDGSVETQSSAKNADLDGSRPERSKDRRTLNDRNNDRGVSVESKRTREPRKTDQQQRKNLRRASMTEGDFSPPVPLAAKKAQGGHNDERSARLDKTGRHRRARMGAPRRALGVDTRPSFFGSAGVCENTEGDRRAASLHADSIDLSRSRLVQDFIVSLISRGPLCGSITTTSSTKVIVLEGSSASLGAALLSFLTPRRDCSRDQDRPELPSKVAPRASTANPPVYQAKASWSFFGDMVARLSMVDNTESVRDAEPLLITILTYDSTFLADGVDIESHRRAMRSFSRKIGPLMEARRLTVEIIVLKTMDYAATGVPKMTVDASNVDSFLLAVQIEVGSMDLNRLQPSRIVSLRVLDHCVLVYQKLVRDWLRPLLPTRSLLLDLPTVRGMQCSLQLTSAYQTMPFAVDSADFERLLADLKEIQRLHVLKPLAIGSVDSSLMYGVPIIVQAALQDNFQATNQMQKLVQGLLLYLQQRQLAILLECTLSEQDSTAGNEMGLFGGCANNTFIFFPQQVTVGAPQSAIMFRYARADQLVESDSFSDLTAFSADQKPDDAPCSLYDAYFQEALDTLQGFDNPLDERLLRATAAPAASDQGTVSDARGVVDETYDDKWVEDYRFWNND